jgi:hypothetical protein
MVHSQHDPASGDPVARARAETIGFTKRKLKQYGLLTLGSSLGITLILKGMPGHRLASTLGIPLGAAFLWFFTQTLYFAAMLIGEWLDKKQHP